jgi:hypothetical protein
MCPPTGLTMALTTRPKSLVKAMTTLTMSAQRRDAAIMRFVTRWGGV